MQAESDSEREWRESQWSLYCCCCCVSPSFALLLSPCPSMCSCRVVCTCAVLLCCVLQEEEEREEIERENTRFELVGKGQTRNGIKKEKTHKARSTENT